MRSSSCGRQSCLQAAFQAARLTERQPLAFGFFVACSRPPVWQAILPAGGLSGRRPTDHSRSSPVFSPASCLAGIMQRSPRIRRVSRRRPERPPSGRIACHTQMAKVQRLAESRPTGTTARVSPVKPRRSLPPRRSPFCLLLSSLRLCASAVNSHAH